MWLEWGRNWEVVRRNGVVFEEWQYKIVKSLSVRSSECVELCKSELIQGKSIVLCLIGYLSVKLYIKMLCDLR